MDLKKAVASAVIIYALIFLVASALLFIKDENIFGSLTLIAATIITYLVAGRFYFKGVKVANPAKEGFMLGITILAVVIAIEIPVMVYGFAASQGWGYLLRWHILLGYAMTILVSVLAAKKAR